MTNKKPDRFGLLILLLGLALGGPILLFSQGPPPMRRHTVTEAGKLNLTPADRRPPERNRVVIEKKGTKRVVSSNAIPVHNVGRFPNRGNPNEIRPQALQIELPADPQPAPVITFIHHQAGERDRHPPGPPLKFGVALNGLLFDPGAAEFYQGDPVLGWQYEALSGAVPLGLDENFAHVQPTGAYHYHGIPAGLLKQLGYKDGKHSPLIGWAADGFPIYCKWGFQDPEDANSKVIELRPSYRLKAGERPGGREPGGKFDGAFVRDYEYVDALGDLDECNGRRCVTPDFPGGGYAYFLTGDWPVIPRAFRGTPVRLGGFERMGPKGPKGPKGKKGFKGPKKGAPRD